MRKGTIALPEADLLEDLVVQVWDTLNHFRSRLGDKAYAEASFDKNGKTYTVRITEEVQKEGLA